MAPTDGITFRGFAFKGTGIRWSGKAFAEFNRRVKDDRTELGGLSMEYCLARLDEYLRGWMSYFGISEHYRPIPEIDHWLRRRVRWIKDQGLISVKDLWVNIHYPAKARWPSGAA